MKKCELDYSLQCSIEELHFKMLKMLKSIDEVCRRNEIRYFLFDGTLLGAVRHHGFIPWDDDVDIAMPREDFNKFCEVAQRELGDGFFVQTIHSDPNYHMYYIPLKIRDNNSTYIEKFGNRYHEGIFIDVFPLDILTDNYSIERKQKKIMYLLGVSKGPFSAKGFPSIKFFLRTFMQLIGHYFIPTSLVIRYVEKVKTKNQLGNPQNIYTYGFELPWRSEFPKNVLFPLSEIEFEGEMFFAPQDPDEVLKICYGDYMQLPPIEERMIHAKYYSLIRQF